MVRRSRPAGARGVMLPGALLALCGGLALIASACSASERAGSVDDEWVGTITTESDVTTVVNESGALWDGKATLIEEASIGVESGDPNYMFARIAGLYATGDEIYVLDDTPALRVYDYQGNHLRNIGGAGQGPGEFERPRWIGRSVDGRLFVYVGARRQLNVYGPGRDEVATWPTGMHMCCLHPMVVTPEGVVWLEHGVVNEERRSYDSAYLAHTADGPADEPLMVPQYQYERWTLRFRDRDIEAIPNAPEIIHQMSPAGLLVAGVNNAYRFEIISPDGSKTVVQRYWDPIEVSATELAYHERSIPARYSSDEGGNDAGLVWDGRLPGLKPAFRWFLATHEGDIWVIRDGPSADIEDCDPDETMPSPLGRGPDLPRPCFRNSRIIDVFDGEGRYLGEVESEGAGLLIPSRSYVRGDTLVTESQDEMGTIMVKRYRIIFP